MNNEDKKRALRLFQYGLFIVTARARHHEPGQPYAAATVTWVSQASFEPPLVMVALRKDSWTNEAVRQTGSFAINLLGENQKEMAGRFFKKTDVDGDQLNGLAFAEGVNGSPLLREAIAYLECEEQERIEIGDHSVIVARIMEAGVRNPDASPILLRDTGWSYGG